MNWTEVVNALSWPLAVSFVAIMYRRPLYSFLPELSRRLQRVSVAGVSIELDAAKQQPASGITSVSGTIELKEFPGVTRTPAIGNLERQLLAHIKAFSGTQDDIINLLVRALAQSRLESKFGYTYALIFGSQIRGLVELAARRRVSADDALSFYNEAISQNREFYQGYGFGGWLGFLKRNDLIAQDDEGVTITEIGEDFLRWLQAMRLPTNKPW